MSNVKFGLSQIGATTPKTAKWAFRVILYLAAAANIIVGTVTEIPEPVKVIILKYSLYGVTLVHAFSKLFGIDISDSEPPTTKK
jgi:hypothetical protein